MAIKTIPPFQKIRKTRFKTTNKKCFRRRSFIALSCSISAFVYGATFDEVVETQLATMQQEQQTQSTIETIDDTTATLINDYQSVLKHQDDLRKYNGQLLKTIEEQRKNLVEQESQLSQIQNLDHKVVPLMLEMIDTLEEFIALDTPFLKAERNERVNNLRNLMVQMNIDNAEKYRRILEAYQIENDYGMTLEAWDKSLGDFSSKVDAHQNAVSKDQVVTFVKIGRLAFYFQTLDGDSSYIWNAASNNWQLVPKSQNRNITKAIRMAREQVPYDLLDLPMIKI